MDKWDGRVLYGFLAAMVAVALYMAATYTFPRSYAYAPQAFGTYFTRLLFLCMALFIAIGGYYTARRDAAGGADA